MLIFVSQLTAEEIKMVVDNHRSRLEADGIYSPEEINEFVEQIVDEKILNLEDAIDADIYQQIKERVKY